MEETIVGSSFQPRDVAANTVVRSRIRRASELISRSTQWRIYTGSLVLSDVILSAAAFFVAGWIRFNVPLRFFNLNASPSIPPVAAVLLGFVPIWIIVFAMSGLYDRRNLLGGFQEYAGAFRATAIGILLIVIVGYMQVLFTPARGWVLMAWLFATLFVMSGRFIMRRVVYLLRYKGFFLSPTLLVGTNPEALSLSRQLLRWRTSGLAVLGFVSEKEEVGPAIHRHLPVLGTLADLDALVQRYEIEELVLATSALSQDQVLSVFRRYGVNSHVTLRLSSGLFEIITTGLEVKELASVPLVRIREAKLTGFEWGLKTLMDVGLSIPLLILSSPILLLLGLAIKLDSPGPVFYRRRVVGLNGRKFDAFKFRTMYTNGYAILEERPELKAQLEQEHKLKEDPRVTRVGRLLRKHSLDELPQLVNVLRREMSLVGPRMITPEETVMYEQWDINLLTVLPGITGLWQVSGRSDVSYSERVRLDMNYIRSWSIWLDMQILWRTVTVMFTGRGAY